MILILHILTLNEVLMLHPNLVVVYVVVVYFVVEQYCHIFIYSVYTYILYIYIYIYIYIHVHVVHVQCTMYFLKLYTKYNVASLQVLLLLQDKNNHDAVRTHHKP